MDKKSTAQIVAECEKKTKIHYDDRGHFFKPRLKGINHMEVGYSKIISNPITIIAELIYALYAKLRDAWTRFKAWLFPRRAKTWCDRVDSHLYGRVTFARLRDLDTPIHNMEMEFWGRTWWLQWRKLGVARTDRDGYYTIPFELRKARNWKVWWVRLELYQDEGYLFDENGKGHPNKSLFKHIKIKQSDLTGMTYWLHTIQLYYWEYRDDTPIPRVKFRDDGKDINEKYSTGRLDAMYEQITPIELTKLKHLEQIALDRSSISIESIQADYPINLTVCIEKKLPGYTRGDEWFGIRMMNGMNRGCFEKDPDRPNHYWMKYFGICNYDHNDEYALPTTKALFEINEKGYPFPKEIHLTGALNAINKDQWQHRVVTPSQPEDWLAAKRLMRVSGAVGTEVEEHFTGTHLNTEQYAIAAFRNLRLNPLAELLLPHLKEVSLINQGADRLIINGYLPKATALTAKGLKARCADLMGMQDWKDWKPMEVLSDQHTVARAETLFWKLVCEYVDTFFAQNIDGIKEHWFEIYRFSQELVEHAVPVFLSNVNLDEWPEEQRKLAKERFWYYSKQYSFNAHTERKRVNGELKAVSPLTEKPDFDSSMEAEIANLKQACSYMIMMATFMHTWINEHQYDDLGEILYNCGGLRFGESERGVMSPESDLSIAPDLTRSTQMLWFTNLLSRTEYGFITKNEDGDVNPIFSKLLLKHEKDFDALGVDIHDIESRTNI